MSTLLSRLTWRSSTEVIVECRQCGTTVTQQTDSCPVCGADEIARYEIPD